MEITSDKVSSGDVKPKASKKDRHMKHLSDLARFLENTNEIAVQEVLLLKREIRESVEVFDINLEKYCKSIDEADFLIDKSEDEVDTLLTKLQSKLNQRAQMIDKLSSDLDRTELKRVEAVGMELKRLVDVLVAIGYQLPDDIERMVANEAFEVNQEVITNRVEHAKTVGELKITHIKLEAEKIKSWELSKVKWRKIRHEKAIEDYRTDIRSPYYNDPDDRKSFMKKFRQGQKTRREEIAKHLSVLLNQNYGTIASATISDLQQNFNVCSENEAAAIQSCYNGLTELRSGADFKAKERVESIRKELHLYGALKVDPKLPRYADQLEPALEDESLVELWRLGGGLKPDVQTLLGELRCEEIVYDRVIESMREKVQFIKASFPLKAVLEERGRLSQLDKVRTLVTKMRSAPRAEIAGVLRSLVPELEDISRMEQLAGIFADTLKEVFTEVNAELESYDNKVKALAALPPSALAGTAVAQTATLAHTKGDIPTSTALGKTGGGKTAKLGASTLKGTKKVEKEGPSVFVDPLLIKGWHRKLGSLFYGTDLSESYQLVLADILQQIEVQRQCNELVDQVIQQESEDLLKRMDRRYNRVIDKIITFLETQATLVSTQTSNLCSFFTNLAKVIEKHRADQKRLDDKSAEELWDIKEDYRIQLEDRESEYRAACQRIREATKDVDVMKHFDEVIEVLGKIQQTYRDYHKHACFAADKYPLWLVDEFRVCLERLCQIMFMRPSPEHPLLIEYDRIFDDVLRFNSSFFDENAKAADVDRLEAAVWDAEKIAEEYASPYSSIPADSALAYVGKYGLVSTLTTVCGNFSIDGFFLDKSGGAVEGGEESAGAEGEVDALKALAASKQTPHAQCPWMKATATALPVSREVLEAMDQEDREEVEAQLAKFFVALVDDVPPPEAAPVAPPPGKKGAAAAAAAPVVQAPAVSIITPGVFPTLSQLSLEDRARYAADKALIEELKTRLAHQMSAEYILEHVPCGVSGSPWVEEVEVTAEETLQMYKNIRHNIVASLESEAFKKMVGTQRRMETIKTEFTDELEDRIRNHWPRRGRVETEIKQPREKELLGHKDKTYRLILTIQEKMVELQSKYSNYLQESRSACDSYVNEMTTLRNALTGNFKNLASLQGLDVKARGTTLDFQAESAQRLQTLGRLSTVDVDAIIAYARDFRKICPLQKPGVEGGYSEQELQEIEVLMEAQCAEMAIVKEQWAQDIHQLSELQTQSLLCQDEFNGKYAKCTQEVAMAEGLGQKYGAPRRRAQERIRTEVSRDERAAGKVDELLALLDFVAAEMQSQEALKAAEKNATSHSHSPSSSQRHNSTQTAAGTSASRAVDGSNRLQYSWQLLLTLRTALTARAKFLDVLAEKSFVETSASPITWMDSERLATAIRSTFGSDSSALTTQPDVPSLEDAVIPGQPAPMATLHAVFEDVSLTCRKETKQLYESEGKGAIVPESLEQWLAEAKDKLLGRHGYQERAWKRLWSQAFRLDQLFNRFKPEELEAAGSEDPATEGATPQLLPPPPHATTAADSASKLSAQGVCLLSLVQAHVAVSKKQWKAATKEFAELLAVWELGRDKHERLLRPRLGSPDKVDELAALDKVETERSQEMQRSVVVFRGNLIRGQAERFRLFCEDVGVAAKALLVMLDTCLRQALLAVPPDTTVPKKHMTLKKLRKAQRIREDVAKGKEDVSQRRLWPGIELRPEDIAAVVGAEDLVPDLGANPMDSTGFPATESVVSPTAAAAAPGGKGKDDKKAATKDKKADKNAPPPVTTKPSLLPTPWLEKIAEMTAASALVSSGHRTVLQHREEAVLKYVAFLRHCFQAVREEYSAVLQQEDSWTQRWQRQVDMLRQGQL